VVLVWVACECYFWPIVPSGFPIGRCGWCGTRPDIEMAEQEKARPLTRLERRVLANKREGIHG
jgi:hypothetical protein